MNNMNRIDGHPNYAYKSGRLEGHLLSIKYDIIPGITVTDPEAFTKYIEAKLDEIHNSAVEYEYEYNTVK